jgi:regulatory protein
LRTNATAFDRAVKLLAACARTEHELRARLGGAGYPPDEIDSAVARMRELGYLDDGEVARARARTLLARGSAQAQVATRLVNQGVDEATASAAVAEGAEGETEIDAARRAIDRRLRGRAPADEAERVRLFRTLVQKGHRAPVAARALGLDWNGDE